MVQSRIKCSGSIKWKTFPSHCVDDLMKGLQLKANVMVGLGFMYRINRNILIFWRFWWPKCTMNWNLIVQSWFYWRTSSNCLVYVKALRKLEGPHFVWAALKMVSFFTAGSWQKETIFGADQTNIRPFLFWQRFWNTHYCNLVLVLCKKLCQSLDHSGFVSQQFQILVFFIKPKPNKLIP